MKTLQACSNLKVAYHLKEEDLQVFYSVRKKGYASLSSEQVLNLLTDVPK